jgi:hypothetical protein
MASAQTIGDRLGKNAPGRIAVGQKQDVVMTFWHGITNSA